MRTVLLLSLLLLVKTFSGCNQKIMDEINKKWELLTSSHNSSEEMLNITNLKDYLQKHRIPFKTILIDEDGASFEYNSFKGNIETIRQVQILFYYKKQEFKPEKSWFPKQINNLYNLYLE